MIELLLVITLSLIVIGGTVGVLIAGMRSEPRIAERTADIQAARVAMERLTREIRQGATVTTATGSTIALVTNVNSATCGGAHAAEARPCRVTYACTSGKCTRTEVNPDGSGTPSSRGGSERHHLDLVCLLVLAQRSRSRLHRGEARVPCRLRRRLDHPYGRRLHEKRGARLVTPVATKTTHSQGGFTMIEVVIATFLLALGSLGILSVVDASTRNNFRSEQSQVVVNVLEKELEQIKQRPFHEVALTGLPSHSSDQDEPDWRVSSGQFAMSRDGTDLRPLVVNGSALAAGGTVAGGAISPAPKPFQTGDIKGAIHTYVVWVNDPKCPEAVCPGSQDIKRVIVVATLDASSAIGGSAPTRRSTRTSWTPTSRRSRTRYPRVRARKDPSPPSGSRIPRATTRLASRSPATTLTHNTLGTCASGFEDGRYAGGSRPDVHGAAQARPRAASG